ncbi:uncharacterized protein LOC116265870 [Nymphaea colorata]|nr:uncharacterized protein LOC116265870 [Nymphaea colorata]XP_031502693.1 uncharacterized protein LOC116265870 [Nymphaea colorata]XP_031502694.1 uncharacterized protein LOC116265870 [Nymphaea colorata]XP_031502695.1 uncharacterized protein LOC116265870 [Nymphaea colorata]XP_031502696.1 uncharacterized protein LOC116265870 [Nymphaea colorata]XP_031502697.1 uncharacterized protein LOC116265870 [Nymphaea colorata]XP_049936891.1 uncharacterized protein LOC116265870 [Nymphaea colorata]
MEGTTSSEHRSSMGSHVYNDTVGNQGFIPQLFASVPSISDASMYLAQTSSYLSSCFCNFGDDGLPIDDWGEQELLPLSPIEERTNLSADLESTTVSCSTSEPSFGSSRTVSLFNGRGRAHTGASFGNTTAAVDTSRSSGSSMFQSLVSRVQKTLRGSSDDIGWLQREPGFPPVEDGTGRFMELLEGIRKGEHKLPDTMVYLLIPGLFSNHGPLYFVNTKVSFSKMGLACHIAKIHSEASVEKNAREIKSYIEEIYWGSKKRVLLLGHSKGGVDAAAALSLYWSDLKDKVAGLALAQSPYGGSPVASDILREGQLADAEARKLMELLICKVIKGDMRALEDLTYEKRREFLRKHKLPEDLPVVSFHTEASISPSVLATLSHIAHAELPRFSLPVFRAEAPANGEYTKVPVILPLAAAMAACALLLQIRYGEKSDGLVARKDAEVPGSVVVRPGKKMDHGWMVYSPLKDDSNEASASQVCEALLALLVEVGQKRRHESAAKDD